MTDSVFDLDTSSLADEGMWCRLRHPVDGAPLSARGQPVRVRLLGIDGERFRALQRRVAARRADLLLRSRGRPDAEAEEELDLDLLAHATLGWENVLLPGGEAFAFSVDNARRLYAERPWIAEQVNRFIADRANFLKASGTS